MVYWRDPKTLGQQGITAAILSATIGSINLSTWPHVARVLTAFRRRRAGEDTYACIRKQRELEEPGT